MKLIDKESIPYEMMYKDYFLKNEGCEEQMVWESEINKMPTVELIRCKDCKYWHCDDVDTYCYKLSIFDTDMNSYCSYAERKEEWVD